MFIAGLAVFDGASYWRLHETFVHFFEYLPMILLLLALIGRLPRWVSWLTALEIVQIGLQYAFARTGGPIAALHVVNAMVLFVVSVILAYRTSRYAWGKAT